MSDKIPPNESIDVEAVASLRPMNEVEVDVVILTILNRSLHVLLAQQQTTTHESMWVIPGSILGFQEGLEEAARHQLDGITDTSEIYLEQLYTFGDPDPGTQNRVITIVYYALIDVRRINMNTIAHSRSITSFPIAELPKMAFDHGAILEYTLQRLRGKLEYTTIGFQLLPNEFTLSELQEVYEAILHKTLDKRNFRKKVLSTDILQDTPFTKMEGPHRPAKLYRFRSTVSRA